MSCRELSSNWLSKRIWKKVRSGQCYVACVADALNLLDYIHECVGRLQRRPMQRSFERSCTGWDEEHWAPASIEAGSKITLKSYPNLRSGSIFVSLCNNIPAGKAKRSGSIFVSLKTKTEPDTNLLPNVCRPLFWLIDICRINQPKLLPLLVLLVCKFFMRGKNSADWLT